LFRTLVDRTSSGLGLVAIVVFSGLANVSLLCAPAIALQLSRELGYGTGNTGLFFSMEFAGYCVAGVSGRWLMPRYNWRKIGLVALIGMVAGNVLTITVLHDFRLLLGVRLLTASCGGLLNIATLSTASRRPDSTRAYGLYILAQCVAGVVGLAVLPPLFVGFGLSAYFSLLAGCLVCVSWLIRMLSPGGEDRSHGAPAITVRAKLRLACWATLLLFYIGLGGIWTFAGVFAKHLSFDPVVSGRFMSVAAFAGVIGAGLASAIGRSNLVAPSVYVGYALMVGSVLLLLSQQQWVFVLAIIAFKFAWTFLIPFVVTIIARLDSSGEILAETFLIAGVGLAAAPSLAGQVVAAGGLDQLVAIEAVFLVISTASASFLLWVTQPSRLLGGSRDLSEAL
jgi:MFS transporter, DHA1 family, inner membrane transport protein